MRAHRGASSRKALTHLAPKLVARATVAPACTRATPLATSPHCTIAPFFSPALGRTRNAEYAQSVDGAIYAFTTFTTHHHIHNASERRSVERLRRESEAWVTPPSLYFSSRTRLTYPPHNAGAPSAREESPRRGSRPPLSISPGAHASRTRLTTPERRASERRVRGVGHVPLSLFLLAHTPHVRTITQHHASPSLHVGAPSTWRPKQPANSNQQSTTNNQNSAISKQHSTVSISNQHSALNNQHSAISNQQSAINRST